MVPVSSCFTAPVTHLDVGSLVLVGVVHADQLRLQQRVAEAEGRGGELVQDRGVAVRVVTCGGRVDGQSGEHFCLFYSDRPAIDKL